MTRREQVLMGLLMLVLVAGGLLVGSTALRAPLAVDVSSLGEVPHRIGGWRRVADVPIGQTAESMLRADYHLSRVYQNPAGGAIEVYVGYYGTERGGRPEHTPDVCYPSAGWQVRGERVIEVDPERGLQANEFEVVREGRHQLVQFWYRSYRSTGLLGGADQILDRLVGRLLDDRSDGALVRVSTPIRTDAAEARSRLVSFAAQLDPLLQEHWPREAPAG